MNVGEDAPTTEERVLFVEARLRIAAVQLDQAEKLCDAERRRCAALETAAVDPGDAEVVRAAQLRAEIASVAATAAEGRVEALHLELRRLQNDDGAQSRGSASMSATGTEAPRDER